MDKRQQIITTLRRRPLFLLYLGLLVVNIGLFSATSPVESPALVVFVGFVVASLDLWVLGRLFVRFLVVLIPKVQAVRRRLTTAIVSFAVFALALASLGQLTWRDFIVVVVIWVLGYLYSLRFRLS